MRPTLLVILLVACGSKKSEEPAAAPPPPPPAAPKTFEDFPVGVGPCGVVGIKEVSTVLGAQLQYLAPEPDNLSCHLVPAIGHAAARTAGMVTADQAAAEVPDLTVAILDAANADWSGAAVAGLGEKAGWTGATLQILQRGKLYRISVIDPTGEPLQPKVLAIGKLVVARVP